MARLVAAFGSSHSVMLAAELADWISGFRESDQRMPYYDREGEPRSYAELLARAAVLRDAVELAGDHVQVRVLTGVDRLEHPGVGSPVTLE